MERLIRGYIYDINPDISIYDESYYRDEYLEIKQKYKNNYIDFLIENQSMIEYIDFILETESLFISRDINTINKNYLYCEIHSSLILSASH